MGHNRRIGTARHSRITWLGRKRPEKCRNAGCAVPVVGDAALRGVGCVEIRPVQLARFDVGNYDEESQSDLMAHGALFLARRRWWGDHSR